MPDAAEFFRRYRLSVYRYFLRVVDQVQEAEDLTQEVFLRIVQGMGRYTAHGREEAWVFTIAPQAPAAASSSVPAVTVTIQALATARAGATGVPRVEVSRTVAVGDRMPTATIIAGQPGGTDPCDLAVVPPGEAAEGYASWTVDGVVQAADETSVTVALALAFMMLQLSRTEAAYYSCNGSNMTADYYGEEVECGGAGELCVAFCDLCFKTSCSGVLFCKDGDFVHSQCGN